MGNRIYQQHSDLDTRIPISQRRMEGGKVLEDNRAAFNATPSLGALKKNSPLTDQQTQLAAMSRSSPTMAAQHNIVESVSNSPYATAQRQRLDNLTSGSTPQLKEQEELAEKIAPLERVEAPALSNNTGLPDKLKNGIESLSGLSMDNVKVHYNSSKPAPLNALAYAQGTDIHVGPGQEQHLPHEAWHVVQQKQGRVKPTMQLRQKVNVNDDKQLEREADAMGEKSKQLGQSNAAVPLKKEASKDVMQRKSPNKVATQIIQLYEAGKTAPSLEEQASVMESAEGDMEGTKATFFKRAIAFAVNTINENTNYDDLKPALSKLSFNYETVASEAEYTKFWNELSVKTPSISSGLVGLLRSSSRHKALQEAADTTPFQDVQNTYTVVKNHLVESITSEVTLAPLLEAQFKGMVGLGMFNVVKEKELQFLGAIATETTGIEKAKQAFQNIMLNFSLANEQKAKAAKSEKEFNPIIKNIAVQLLKDGVILPPGGEHQIYTVLLKNANATQLGKLNEIYQSLEEYGDRAKGVVLKKVAGFPLVKEFLKKNNNMEISEFEFRKPSLTDALMSTLFVARLLDPEMAVRYPVEEKIKGEWKNGGNLVDDVVVEKSSDESGYEASYDMGSVEDKIKKADEQLKMLVSNSVLSKIKRPKVKVDESFGHRAFQHSDHISVSISDNMDVIVHEVGHYIEINNPALWLDVSLLLQSRHQKTMGPNAQSGSISEQEENPHMKGRYQGAYPVTGEYTSKIYETEGATEVTSMTMEYLSTPEKARELIKNDPFQALLVLRQIQPDDPELKEIYSRNEKYLPHKDPEERESLVKRVKRFEQELNEMGLKDGFKAQLENLDTMGLSSLRKLADQMEALPTSERIMQLIETYPQLAEDFETQLTEAVTYPIYKLNQLYLSMQVASYKMR